MSLELIIRPEAEADLLGAYRWYNDQVRGLGEEFLAEVDRGLELIRDNPESCRKLHRNFRRGLIRRFPYGIFYVARDESVVVFAVLHSARDPQLWKQRGRNAR